MKVLATVLHVDRGENKGKPKADITLKMGREAHVVTLWHNNIQHAESAEKAVGKSILADLRVEVYNGRPQFSWGQEIDFSEARVELGKPLQAAKTA